MLPAEKLLSLAKGAIVLGGLPFQGLAPKEKMAFKVEKWNEARQSVTFSVWYFDVPIAEVFAQVQADGRVSWMENTRKAQTSARKRNGAA